NKELSIVLSSWEDHGCLSWPNVRSSAALTKILKSGKSPEANWKKIPCVVKRQGLSYNDGLQELEVMILESETEDDSRAETTVKKPPEVEPTYDLFAIMNEYTGLHNNGEELIVQEVAAHETPSTSAKIDHLISEMAEFKAIMLRAVASNQQSPSPSNGLITQTPGLKKSLPLTTITEMEEMEQNLQNDQAFEQLIQDFLPIVGSSGKNIGKGREWSYLLIDQIFARELLTNFTWTGSCRGSGTKKSLRDYNKILNLFLQLVNKADSSFNMKDLEEFMKCVLKNATKRAAGSQRKSTPKVRKQNSFIPISEND
uniref:DUF4806 domain-containing protein n=1 Tax=Lutzomyia longipalpis TaxID=7200 RepID=A0A1B0ETT2_LUTLO